jgi:hypothetical protein
VPFQGNIFEGVGLFRDPVGNDGLFVRSGVNALGKPSVLAASTCVFQGYCVLLNETERLFPLFGAMGHAP